VTDRDPARSAGGPALGGSTSLIAAIVGLVAILVVLAPVVLAGEAPSFVRLGLLPTIALVVGVVIRRQPGAVNRMVGAIVIGLGIVAALALGVLLWALVNGLGRPY
jgi:hypothetical protein